jgi:hypothetical protein
MACGALDENLCRGQNNEATSISAGKVQGGLPGGGSGRVEVTTPARREEAERRARVL